MQPATSHYHYHNGNEDRMTSIVAIVAIEIAVEIAITRTIQHVQVKLFLLFEGGAEFGTHQRGEIGVGKK